jgi:hypothetical protein
MKSFYIFLTVLISSNILFACWSIPSPYKVYESRDKSFFLRICRDEKRVELRNAENFELTFSANIKNFSPLFSKFESNGTHIVHIFGNHQVNSVHDTAIAVYTKDGLSHAYQIKEFMSSIVKNHHKSSIDPNFFWHNRIYTVTADRINLLLSNETYGIFMLNEKKHRVIKDVKFIDIKNDKFYKNMKKLLTESRRLEEERIKNQKKILKKEVELFGDDVF